jgi:perosamine synthetase
MPSKILYTKPSITDLEVGYATDAARNGWGEKCYEYITRFEKAFSEHLGSRYAIATSSCTGAMHIGLAALGVGPGDEVIIAETNWIAIPSVIHHLGATPLLVDILPDTLCLDPEKVEAAITPRTKAIIAVHLYGNLCEMDALLDISRKYGIPVIEDSAEAIGSCYHGKRAGSMGYFGTFSFHGTKTITTGEGGMLVTSNDKLYETFLTLSNHGRARNAKKQFWPQEIGFKFKMSNIQAALGCGQLERVEQLVDRKRAILNYYKRKLNKFPGISLNPEPLHQVNGAWMPTAIFAPELGITREMLLDAFSKENIDARVVFWPLSELGLFPKNPDTHNAHEIPKRAINFPSYHDITDEELDRVVGIIEVLMHGS